MHSQVMGEFSRQGLPSGLLSGSSFKGSVKPTEGCLVSKDLAASPKNAIMSLYCNLTWALDIGRKSKD